ncbi:MAG TPA: hypothetical protein VLG46_10795 [Anaerolineae bacterium]|nr:hypothetical protein [Anaerolineae bacterium]
MTQLAPKVIMHTGMPGHRPKPQGVRTMINLYPCIIWPLVVLAAIAAYRMWKSRRGFQNSWLVPVAFFVGVLLILGSVVWLRFEEFWLDGLFALYIPQ